MPLLLTEKTKIGKVFSVYLESFVSKKMNSGESHFSTPVVSEPILSFLFILISLSKLSLHKETSPLIPVAHKLIFFLSHINSFFFFEPLKMESILHDLANQCFTTLFINISVLVKMIILKESFKKFYSTCLPYSNSTNCFEKILNESAIW